MKLQKRYERLLADSEKLCDELLKWSRTVTPLDAKLDAKRRLGMLVDFRARLKALRFDVEDAAALLEAAESYRGQGEKSDDAELSI